MNFRLAGIVLVVVGFFMVALGGIFLSIGIHDYNHAVYESNVCRNTACISSPPYVTIAEAEALIAESALGLSAGMISLIGGFLLLRRKPIP